MASASPPASPASPAQPPAPPLQLLRWQSRTQVFREKRDGLELAMVRIPAGSFVMGSPPQELDCGEDEAPQHRVELGEFLLGQTPITQAQWREVAQWQERPGERWGRDLDPEPSFFQPRSNPKARSLGRGRFSLLEGEIATDQRPVDNVSWRDAMEFCSRLRQRTGRRYTLPSEAQWEYACRAGSSTPFHFGPTLTPELANYNGTFSYADGPKGANREQTMPVGMFAANAWGLHDMHGNVWEWCLDHWHDSYEGAPADGSAWLTSAEPKKKAMTDKANNSYSEEPDRLLRGGSWDDVPRDCRSAYRDHIQPDGAYDDVGFRVVCLPQGPSLNPQSLNPSTLAVS
jgi:formylglycine-generating enzyme required for sulfatase activity